MEKENDYCGSTELLYGKTGQNFAFWTTSAASTNGANAHANHIIFFYLNIKYVPTYFFINIWVGYLNNTKCIDKGFLVL